MKIKKKKKAHKILTKVIEVNLQWNLKKHPQRTI